VSDLASTGPKNGLAGTKTHGEPEASANNRGKAKQHLDAETGLRPPNLYEDVLNRPVPDRFLDLLADLERPQTNAIDQFDTSVSRLGRLNQMLSDLADESRRDLALISVKREQLERLVSENDVRLQRVTEGT
jgi:hypothetical protein